MASEPGCEAGDRAPAAGRAPDHCSALPPSTAASESEPGNHTPTIAPGTPMSHLTSLAFHFFKTDRLTINYPTSAGKIISCVYVRV